MKTCDSRNSGGDCETAHLTLPNGEDKITSWSSLPVDVRDFILAKLNYLDLFRVKVQSKVFKHLIHSKEFHGWRGKVREGVLATSYFFVGNGIWQCKGYDSTAKAWMRLPPFTSLPHLDPELFKDHSICVAGCLICANVGKAQERLIVFHPSTGRKRELPRLVHRRNPVLRHTSVDSKQKFYKVTVAGSSRLDDGQLSKITEAFASRTKVWIVTHELLGPLFVLNEHQTGAYVNGILYCIAFLEGDGGKGLQLAFCIVEEKWLPQLTRSLPFSTSSDIVQLVESNGEVYLFSELEQERCSEPRQGHWPRNATKKGGSWGLEVYPEYTCVLFGDGKMCAFNTIASSGGGGGLEVYPEYTCVLFGDGKMCAFNTIASSGGGGGLEVYPEYTCVLFGDGKLCAFNTIASSGGGGGLEVYPGVVKIILRSLKSISTFVLSTLDFAVATPAVVEAIAPEAATDQGALEAVNSENSSSFAFRVVACIGVLFTIVGVGVAIIDCRRRRRTNTAISGGDSTLNRAGRMLQTHTVQRWRILDILHYEYLQRSEEAV